MWATNIPGLGSSILPSVARNGYVPTWNWTRVLSYRKIGLQCYCDMKSNVWAWIGVISFIFGVQIEGRDYVEVGQRIRFSFSKLFL